MKKIETLNDLHDGLNSIVEKISQQENIPWLKAFEKLRAVDPELLRMYEGTRAKLSADQAQGVK